ncbi:uncharacterized protein LOC126195494 [Schistocerca nitens]|uniref:uncharacterized protein LOC126195494 n=1 Tax=Schistocerca nitens TaxID=7011 RepID=UPI002119631F|nr:uncharacterized protein LOC126195494 [Schistocerca nitens]
METADWWRDASLADNNKNNNNNNDQNINHRFSQSSLHGEERVADCDNAQPRQQPQQPSNTTGGQLSPSDGVPSRHVPRHCRYTQQQVMQLMANQNLTQVHRTTPSAAAAFFHRASERLYYARLAPGPAAAGRESAGNSSSAFSFSEAVRRAPAALPPQLLRRLARGEPSHTGKVSRRHCACMQRRRHPLYRKVRWVTDVGAPGGSGQPVNRPHEQGEARRSRRHCACTRHRYPLHSRGVNASCGCGGTKRIAERLQ